MSMSYDDAFVLSEQAAMACAEVGVTAHAKPFDHGDGYGWTPSILVRRGTDRALTRKAWALVNLKRGRKRMACFAHSRGSNREQYFACLKVAVTDVLIDPAVTCGAP
jgi:hypothetical protein